MEPPMMGNRILVINSDKSELRKIRKILGSKGYEIITATDKETAIEICRKINIYMVLAEIEVLEFSSHIKLP